jgi:tetratricopeptide (TPR) repeat protein
MVAPWRRGSGDQTVRLWNSATRRELLQLDAGSVELGDVKTLAFSPDGKHLLAGGGRGTAFWSAAPIVWNDPDRAAAKLRLLLQSKADFRNRIRMLSENLRLHEALAKLGTKDVRVRAALAATEANWFASRHAWPAAVAAFDRLVTADPTEPEDWLRTPGLLRLATALLHQDRPRDAAALLQGSAKRRALDGLLEAFARVARGMMYSAVDGTMQVTELQAGSPAARSGLRPGDLIVKVNDTDVTNASIAKLPQMLGGKAGTKIRLTVRHPGKEKPELIELTSEPFVEDASTGDVLYPLRTSINERLAKEPRNPALHELRAELAGQWSDAQAQVADYTAAIDALSQQKAEAAAADLQRLYRRRGSAYLASEQWQKAIDDYARIVTDATTDDALLSNQALAQANVIWLRESAARWTVLKPAEVKSKGGATLTELEDHSILAGGVNAQPDQYTLRFIIPERMTVRSMRLEALTHDSLPGHGPGRGTRAGPPPGCFALSRWDVTAKGPGGVDSPRALSFRAACADYSWNDAPLVPGKWNISFGSGKNRTSVWSLSEPPTLEAGTELVSHMRFNETPGWADQNLGRFRISVSSDPAAFEGEKKYLALTDPWQKLAAAYQLQGDQRAIDQLVERRPKLAGPIGDLFTQGKDEDKDWSRAVEIYSRGITPETLDVDLLSKRARAYEALTNGDAAAADWSRAATGNPEGAKLLAEFAQRLAAAGQVRLANGQFAKAQALYEGSLAADPENDVVATELAELLLNKHENGKSTPWKILQPTKMKSEGGATLTLLHDNSILASGVNPDKDVYVIEAEAQGPIEAIRLEAIPDASMPAGGSGRAPTWGNFVLTDFRALAGESVVTWNRAAADFSQEMQWNQAKRFPIDFAIDQDEATGWAIWPRVAERHWAVFIPSQPIPAAGKTRLTIRLAFRSEENLKYNLGRFRVSVSGDPAAFEREQQRFAAMKPTDPWAKLAAAYHVIGDQRALDTLVKHHPGAGDAAAAEREIAAGRTRDALVHLATQYAANPEDTLLLLKLAPLQVWFGQDQELAATCRRRLAWAKNTTDPWTAQRVAKVCCLVPSTDQAQLEAVLAVARNAVQLGKDSGGLPWFQMTLGMAEYRSGHFAEADAALLAAVNSAQSEWHGTGWMALNVTGTSALYRAMSLFRQGKEDEARQLAIEAVSKMTPLPRDEKNPLAGDANRDDLVLWLAYKEAKAMIKFETIRTREAKSSGAMIQGNSSSTPARYRQTASRRYVPKRCASWVNPNVNAAGRSVGTVVANVSPRMSPPAKMRILPSGMAVGSKRARRLRVGFPPNRLQSLAHVL